MNIATNTNVSSTLVQLVEVSTGAVLKTLAIHGSHFLGHQKRACIAGHGDKGRNKWCRF